MIRDPAAADSNGAAGPSAELNLSARTLAGVRWSYLSAGVSVVMQLIYTATMSRLLDDDAFGLMALAQVVVNFGLYFAQMGVGRALIQKRELAVVEVRAAFVSATVLGSMATAILWLLAPVLAGIFDAPKFVGVIRAMALSFTLMGLGSTAHSLMRRQLRFKELAIIEMIAFFIGYLVVGIAVAVAGGGVYSLVAAVLTANIVGSTLSYSRARHAVRPTLRRASFRQLYAFGVRTSATQVLEFLGSNLDTAAVGRYASAGLLGQYNRAYYLVALPIHHLQESLMSVLFPSLSKIQDERERLRSAYVAMLMITGALVLPICAGLAVAAPEVVHVVLGSGWETAAAVVPMLAVAVSGKVLSRFPAIFAEARGELNRKIVVELTSIAVLVGLLAVAAGGDLMDYAAALAAAEVVRHGLYQLILGRLIGVGLRDIPAIYGPVVVTSTVVGVSIALVRYAMLGFAVPVLLVMLAEMMAGALSLALTVRWGPGRLRGELLTRLVNAGVLPTRRRAVRLGARLLLGSVPDPVI